ncbi:MAG: His/Gly/Thr/Pro-type tRNA ligase C-terminal domain-containing protein, partial [Bacteroidota bacterium]
VVMEELGLFEEIRPTTVEVLLVNFGAETRADALKALNQLRQVGIASEYYPDAGAKMRKQFTYADKKDIPYTLIIGTEEAASGIFQLKNMKTGEQEALKIEAIVEKLKVVS